jgi:hypothetical protein
MKSCHFSVILGSSPRMTERWRIGDDDEVGVLG